MDSTVLTISIETEMNYSAASGEVSIKEKRVFAANFMELNPQLGIKDHEESQFLLNPLH